MTEVGMLPAWWPWDTTTTIWWCGCSTSAFLVAILICLHWKSLMHDDGLFLGPLCFFAVPVIIWLWPVGIPIALVGLMFSIPKLRDAVRQRLKDWELL